MNSKSKRIEGQFVSGLIMRSEGRADLGKGASDPSNPEADNVFAVPRGTSIVQPGEDLLQTPNVADAGVPKPVKSVVPPEKIQDEAEAT